MTARVIPSRAVLSCALLLALGACSTLGTPASPPGPLPHGGTGQFRDLSSQETGLAPMAAGITLVAGSGFAVDDVMPFRGDLFYAGAPSAPRGDAGTMDDAGAPSDAGVPRDAALDANVDAGPEPIDAVDWSRYQGRRILRSPRSEEWGFQRGTEVFTASEPWEGGYVTDPWVVAHPDGRLLMFYAAAGGIGVASATSVEGPWTRVGTSPVLGAMGGAVPRRPSVVVTRDMPEVGAAFLMYYELEGTLRLARSDDGTSFTDAGALDVPPIAQRDDRDGNEISIGGPGAIVVVTPAGRSVLRVYYESRRDNGTVLIGMLGTSDGPTLEQYPLPMFSGRDRQRPAPRYVDQRVTLLYTWAPRGQTGQAMVSITPAGTRLNDVAPPAL
ncbi:MAG: hypothetical protein U0234_26075 [Sandaracinus sp.]